MAPKRKESWTLMHLFLILIVGITAEVDLKRYNEGKDQYELMHQRSQMPLYGQCWQDSLVLLQKGCRRLTDEVQARLAIAYLSCFLQIQGRDGLECDPSKDIKECTKHMSESDRGSLSTFFIHTQNMCYFLQAQVWHDETEKTVSRLADSSSQVASRLEASHKLQENILTSQNQSLLNQDMLMRQAYNLKDVINTSSDSVKNLFEDLKLSTKEQGQVMGELFDQLKGLRSTIFGEVFGFYSFIYHFLSILVCYVLTSTGRTSGARFWLFLVVTLNMVVEQTLLKFISLSLWPTLSADGKVNDEHLYWLQKQVRRLFLVVGLSILTITVYIYRDITSLNNQLLTEIRKQNSDICRFLSGQGPNLSQDKAAMDENVKEIEDDFSDSDYTSDNNHDASDLDLSDADSDKTFILADNEHNEASEVESVCEEIDNESDRMSLMDELLDLKRSTPVREMEDNPRGWLERSLLDTQFSSPGQHSYNLRRRPPATPSPNSSPALRIESAKSFSKTVEHLQKISEKNSRLMREYIKVTPDSSPLLPQAIKYETLSRFDLPTPPRHNTRQRSATPDNLSVSSRASTLRRTSRK